MIITNNILASSDVDYTQYMYFNIRIKLPLYLILPSARIYLGQYFKGVVEITGTWFAMLTAMIAGISMAVQGSLNAVLGKYTGQMEATFVVHIIGSTAVGIIILFGLGKGDLSNVLKAPWYAYLGGILSVVIIYGVIASIPKVGVSLATTAIIVGQVSMALLIDHFGFFGLDKVAFTWTKFFGLVALALGAKLML